MEFRRNLAGPPQDLSTQRKIYGLVLVLDIIALTSLRVWTLETQALKAAVKLRLVGLVDGAAGDDGAKDKRFCIFAGWNFRKIV